MIIRRGELGVKDFAIMKEGMALGVVDFSVIDTGH